MAFWIPRSQTLNFPTQVLLALLNPDPTSRYWLVPSPDDARHNRIRVPAYERITIGIDLDNEIQQYYVPGFEQPVPGLHGALANFLWIVSWQTTATTGYIVQEVTTEMDAYTEDGA